MIVIDLDQTAQDAERIKLCVVQLMIVTGQDRTACIAVHIVALDSHALSMIAIGQVPTAEDAALLKT